MMKCKYCGAETNKPEICSKCYDKLELIRKIKKIGRQLKGKN